MANLVAPHAVDRDTHRTLRSRRVAAFANVAIDLDVGRQLLRASGVL